LNVKFSVFSIKFSVRREEKEVKRSQEKKGEEKK
jgi:hypothetical protein